ncbi:MAG: PPC domain-containing protein [Rheinheimera sp.]|nr:PPC domain-containing protein [Rheinheimera sp.]
MTVPAGRTNLTISTAGGTGDADLYVRLDSKPTLSSYSCRPYKTGKTESCSFTNPTAGTYRIGIYGYAAVTGLTLSTSHQ